MPDQDDSATPSSDPGQHPEPQPELLSPTVTERQVGAQTQQRSYDQQATATEMRREFKWFEWSSVVINLALAIIGVCALRVYNGQLKAMQAQLTEMQGSGKQTDQLIGLYQRQLTQLASQAANTHELAIQAENQTEATRQQMRNTGKQFQLEERPVVFVSNFSFADPSGKGGIGTLDKGKPLFVNIYYANTGKSAALNIGFHYHLLFGDNAQNIRPDPPDPPNAVQGSVLPPASPVRFFTAISAKDTYTFEPFGVADPSLIIPWNGEEPIFVFGRIDYEDRFGTRYCTPFVEWHLHGDTWADAVTASIQLKDGTSRPIPKMCPDKTTP